MENFRRNRVLASLALFSAALFWGINYLAQQKASAHMGPFSFVTARMLLGSLVILIFIVLSDVKQGRPLSFWRIEDDRRATLRGGIILGLMLMASVAFQQVGIGHTTVGKAGFIAALNVVMVPILLMFTGIRVRLYQWLGILGAFLGIAMLTLSSVGGLSIGDFFMFLAMTLTALAVIINGRLSKSPGINIMNLTFLRLFVGGISSLLISIIIGESVSLDLLYSLKIPILFSGIFASGLAFLFQTWGQRYLSDVSTSLLMSLESVFAAASGWIVLNQTMSPKEILGAVLILVSTTGMQVYEEIQAKKLIQDKDELAKDGDL